MGLSSNIYTGSWLHLLDWARWSLTGADLGDMAGRMAGLTRSKNVILRRLEMKQLCLQDVTNRFAGFQCFESNLSFAFRVAIRRLSLDYSNHNRPVDPSCSRDDSKLSPLSRGSVLEIGNIAYSV